MVFTVHATKKLLDRVKQPVHPAVSEPTSQLGNWYATVLFWKPQIALFVNERTLVPVLMPLAPAATVLDRFPSVLDEVLRAHRLPDGFVRADIAGLGEGTYAKTANRSVTGIMNEFSTSRVCIETSEVRRTSSISRCRSRERRAGPLYQCHVSPGCARLQRSRRRASESRPPFGAEGAVSRLVSFVSTPGENCAGFAG